MSKTMHTGDTMKSAWAGPWDVVVVGNGLAGSAAALFAAKRGLSVAVVGSGSQLPLSSGLLDLAGMVPGDTAYSTRPWETLSALAQAFPGHPYGKIGAPTVREAFETFLGFLDAEGVGYRTCEANGRLVTSVGTPKASYALPETMVAGATALKKGWKTLIVGLRGLKGFQASQVAQSAAGFWPGLCPVEVAPEGLGRPGDLYPEALARELDLPQGRERLIQAITPYLNGHRAVGLPPVIGMEKSREALSHLEETLQVPCFEIPGMPPTAAGVRLREALDRAFSRYGVAAFVGGHVTAVADTGEGFFLTASLRGNEKVISAHRMILATGRFMGGGLVGDRHRVTEPLLGLPVTQPPCRDDWHRCDLLDARGHAVNRAGVTVDEAMRPLSANGAPVHPNLFAVGSILAHQDWKREKSGAGISLATAFRAAASCDA